MAPITITAKLWKADATPLEVEDEVDVDTLRAMILSLRPEMGDYMKICHKGRFLKDDQVLRTIGLTSGDIVVCMKPPQKDDNTNFVAVHCDKKLRLNAYSSRDSPASLKSLFDFGHGQIEHVMPDGRIAFRGDASLAGQSLRWWFGTQYRKGLAFMLNGFERLAGTDDDDLHVLLHVASGIKVWEHAIVLCDDSEDAVVVFHYSDLLGFRNITALDKQATEIYAALHVMDEKGQDGKLLKANAWYGKGAYGTAKGPDDFQREFDKNKHDLAKLGILGVVDLIVDNNYRNMALRDGFENYAPKVKYCIPLLVSSQNAYDVNMRSTPEMVDYGVAPGFNLRGMKMNEEGRPMRDQWVVRIADERGVQNARAVLLSVLRRRAAKGGYNDIGQLAFVLMERGEYAEAAALFKESWETAKKIWGVTSRHAMTDLDNWTICLDGLGQYEEAEALCKESYESSLTTLGAAAYPTLRRKMKWAVGLRRLGQYAKAEVLSREAYQSVECTFGATHEKTLRSLHDWLHALDSLGDHATAEPYARRCYEASKSIFGAEEPFTLSSGLLWSKCLLGCSGADGGSLSNVGQAEEAEKLMCELYNVAKHTFGFENSNTLIYLTDWCKALSSLNRHAEAEPLKQECYQVSKRVLGAEHDRTLDRFNSWIVSVQKMGRRDEAAMLLQECYKLTKKIHGAKHPQTLVVLSNIASNLFARGRFVEGEPLLREVFEERVSVLGRHHPKTQATFAWWQDVRSFITSTAQEAQFVGYVGGDPSDVSLKQLQEMGFGEVGEAILKKLLEDCHGDVMKVVEILMLQQ